MESPERLYDCCLMPDFFHSSQRAAKEASPVPAFLQIEGLDVLDEGGSNRKIDDLLQGEMR
jgi:hypothetical protein